MKKNILWSIVALIAAALLTPCLTACSDDDDDKVNVNPAILGYWDIPVYEATVPTILFQKNGKGAVQTYNFQTNTYATERTFTFETEPETRMKAEIVARGKITYENGEVDDFEADETGYLHTSSGSYQKKADIIGSWTTFLRKYEFQKGGKGIVTISYLPTTIGMGGSAKPDETQSFTYKEKDERTGTINETAGTYYYVIVGNEMYFYKDAAHKEYACVCDKRD